MSSWVGERLNIREIAKKAGVSVATVSRVLNHPESVAPKTRTKIEKIIQEEEYTPNWLARGLNFNKTGIIGLMIPHILDPVYMEIAKGVEDVAHMKGYVTFMCNVEEDLQKEKAYLESMVKRRVDGIILISSGLEEKSLQQRIGNKTPVVLIGNSKRNSGINTVSVDYKIAAAQVVSHLVSIGHKRIAILYGNNPGRDNQEKLDGYMGVLEEAGLSLREEYTASVENSIEGGYLGAKKMAELTEPPEAIFATSDRIAFGAMDAIKDKDIRIPEEIAVVGFDNERLSNLVEPKLTTVDVPLHKMGVYGARLLFDIVEGEAEQGSRNILLQTKLKIRKSCGHKERIGEMF